MLDHIDVEVAMTGALTDEQRAALMAVAQKCPVHRTLKLRDQDQGPADDGAASCRSYQLTIALPRASRLTLRAEKTQEDEIRVEVAQHLAVNGEIAALFRAGGQRWNAPRSAFETIMATELSSPWPPLVLQIEL